MGIRAKRVVAARGATAARCMAIALALAGVAGCGGRPVGVQVPLDRHWQAEIYAAGIGVPLGARGIRSAVASRGWAPPFAPVLVVDASFKLADRDRRRGEVFRELAGVPGLGDHVDLDGGRVTVGVDVPLELVDTRAPVGAQIFVESEDVSGLKARQYGEWTNLDRLGTVLLSLEPSGVDARGHTDAGFSPTRSTRVGVKVGLNDSAEAGYEGRVNVSAVTIELREPRPSHGS